MPSSKLREVTGANSRDGSKRSVNIFRDNPVMSGPRTSRPKRKMVEVDTSDEEDLRDQEEDEVDDEGPPVEDDDADGDVDMDDTPPQPPSRRHAKSVATPATTGKGAKSVEAKEMELHGDDEEDDEELSDLGSDAEGEPEDQEESGVPDDTGNGNGEGDLDEEDEVDDEDLDSDAGSAADFSKLTKRQRGSLGNDFLQLPMGEFVGLHGRMPC